MKCTNCGEQLDKEAKFCSKCGQVVVKEGKSKRCSVFIIVVCVVILAAVISGIWYRYGRKKYPVQISVYSVSERMDNYFGDHLWEKEERFLPRASVVIRAGFDSYRGLILASLETEDDGKVHIDLPTGKYTAQIMVDGYLENYMNFRVEKSEKEVEGYVLSAVQPDQLGVLLTWDAPKLDEKNIDFDLILQENRSTTESGEIVVGGGIQIDGKGNRLVIDGGDDRRGSSTNYEVMYVNASDIDNYILYVNNYTYSVAGEEGTDKLAERHAHVSIFDNSGFVNGYSFSDKKDGVLWEVAELNGNRVKKVGKVYSSTEDGWWRNSKECKVTEKTFYDENGITIAHFIYKYDEQERIVSYTNYQKESVAEHEEYRYDEEGNESSTIAFNADGKIIERKEYCYDKQGNTISEVSYNGNETINWRKEYRYDEQGNKLSYICYDENGTMVERTECGYDKHGNTLKVVWYDEDGKGASQRDYDEYNNLLNAITECSDGSSIYSEISYDENGCLVSRVEYDVEGVMESRHEYRYDEMGNRLWEIEYDADGTIVDRRYEYCYDKMGNETMRIWYRERDGEFVIYEHEEKIYK